MRDLIAKRACSAPAVVDAIFQGLVEEAPSKLVWCHCRHFPRRVEGINKVPGQPWFSTDTKIIPSRLMIVPLKLVGSRRSRWLELFLDVEDGYLVGEFAELTLPEHVPGTAVWDERQERQERFRWPLGDPRCLDELWGYIGERANSWLKAR